MSVEDFKTLLGVNERMNRERVYLMTLRMVFL